MSSRDVRLRSGSPAIGAGRTVGDPSTDFFARLFRTPPSVGAVEVEDTTGVEPFDVPGAHPASHPVTGPSVTLRVDTYPVEWVRVWDGVGREYPCRWEVLGDGSIELHIEELSKGLYIIVCKAGKRLLFRSVVVN